MSTSRKGKSSAGSQEELAEVPVIGEGPEALAPSRTSLKRERVGNEKALAQLASDLLQLDEAAWDALDVPGPTIDALLDARKIRTYGAKGRQMRLIRATLRAADWMELRRRIDLRRIGISPTPGDSRVTHWCEQLLIHGDAGLARFVESYEQADRKRLRQLVRNVKTAPEGKRGKSRLVLERALAHLVEEGDESGAD